jgi:ankyrin repeat protein
MPPSQQPHDRDGRTELHHSVIKGQTERVRTLLDAGEDPNVADKGGWTPLHFAAQENRLEIASVLLERGAKVDAQDSYGNSPLWRAVFASEGKGEMIQLLRRAGANPRLANNTDVSPLTLSQRIANFDVKQFFSDLIPT